MLILDHDTWDKYNEIKERYQKEIDEKSIMINDICHSPHKYLDGKIQYNE